MMKFANIKNSWFNIIVRNSTKTLKDKIISKYSEKYEPKSSVKSTDINVLLNRVRTTKKAELRKRIIFLALLLFSVILVGVFTLI